MAAESRATTLWEGDLAHGSGTATPESGAFGPVDVSWASRTARSAGKTSPEELLAAAHAACYCMGLSHELAEAGNPPERLEATATVDVRAGRRSAVLAHRGDRAGSGHRPGEVRGGRRGRRSGLPDLGRPEGQRRDQRGRDAGGVATRRRSSSAGGSLGDSRVPCRVLAPPVTSACRSRRSRARARPCRSGAGARSSARRRPPSRATGRSSRSCAGWRTSPGTSRPASRGPRR